MNKKIKLIVIMYIVTNIFSTSFAYMNNHNGILFRPMNISPHSSFSSNTNSAINNACVEINNAGVGNVVFKTINTNNTNQYPLSNGKNEITKGLRGNSVYLAQANSTLNYFGKSIECDIDINVSYPVGNVNSTTTNVYDVQNFITHELLHLAGSDDLYSYNDSEKTSYWSCTIGEIKKRTLEVDDKNLLDYLY